MALSLNRFPNQVGDNGEGRDETSDAVGELDVADIVRLRLSFPRTASCGSMICTRRSANAALLSFLFDKDDLRAMAAPSR